MFDYKYDFSIVMGYYNRKTQVKFTLDDFEEKYKDYKFEVIIIDDNSNEEHKLHDIIKNYSFPITYNVISKIEKGSRINPCSVYNKGFRLAQGKYVFIQNPECCHIGNLFEYITNNQPEREYLAFSCYNISIEKLMPQFYANPKIITDQLFGQINRQFGVEWYNHPEFRSVHFHFCAVIKNDYLRLLGGFDEKFKDGYWFDDNEILMSIKYNLGLEVKTIDPKHGMVVHQYHKRDSENTLSKYELERRKNNNKNLFENMLENHRQYNFKYPKLLHLYWDGSPLSYLNLCTVLSFNKYNAFWKINIYLPKNPNTERTWLIVDPEEEYKGKDYFNELKKISNVNIHYIDFDLTNFQFKDANEIIKSDYLKYYILNKFGGVWSDFDIIFQKSIEETYNQKKMDISNNQIQDKKIIFYHYRDIKINNVIIPSGLFISIPSNSLLQCLLNNYHEFYDKSNYQCLGSNMLTNLVFNVNCKKMASNINNNELQIDSANMYLPIKWYEVEKYYNKNYFNFKYNALGFHWFNNSKESSSYINNLKNKNIKHWVNECLMDKLISQYFNICPM
jgi:hypothetical protein